jgi:hypothetical protein
LSSSPSRVPPPASTSARRDGRHGGVRVAQRHLARDAGQAGAHREDLGRAGRPPRGGVREAQQRVRVALHRAADVDQQDHAARTGAGRAVAQRRRLAAGREPRPQGPATVDLAAQGRPQAAGHPPLPRQPHRGEQPPQVLPLDGGEQGDVAVAQLLDGGGRGDHRRCLLRSLAGRAAVARLGDELQLGGRQALPPHDGAGRSPKYARKAVS